jgi:hypothetical protein
MLKSIALTQGKRAWVSGSDFEYLNQWKWLAKKDKRGNWYACRVENGHLIQMHRLIMGAPDGTKVDHQNGNGLHNWRGNLRVCTNAENSRNRQKNKNNTSGYKGVVPDRGKFRARIKVNYRLLNIGTYNTPEEAAHAYDRAAKEHHGKFARLNFPE